MRSGFVSKLKGLIAPTGRRPRRVLAGPYRGLTFDLDLQTQTQFVLGLWEAETNPFLRTALRRAEWLIDVGAGFGELCVLFRAKGKASQAFAIEPDDAARRLLRVNLELNRLSERDVVVVAKPAGASRGPESIAIDDLPVDRKRPGLIKIDVDGAEVSVLRSAERLIREAPVDLLVETHSTGLEHDCIDLCHSFGLHTTVIGNAWWRAILPEERPIDHNRWLWASRLPAA